LKRTNELQTSNTAKLPTASQFTILVSKCKKESWQLAVGGHSIRPSQSMLNRIWPSFTCNRDSTNLVPLSTQNANPQIHQACCVHR